MRVAASWYAVNGMNITIVLPTVEATLSAAWDITQDLKHLGRAETCTPLMSPSRLHERAMKAAAASRAPCWSGGRRRCGSDQLSYGCALAHHTQSSHPYPPGEEPCRPLFPLPRPPALPTCPWMATCGKYEQHRQACTASVVVTNHHNFMAGRFHLGVRLDGRRVADLSVAEFAFRRSHTLMIDEVDQFPSVALDLCSSELVLDSRRSQVVPLRELDEDKARLRPRRSRHCARRSRAPALSEFLLASICENQLHLRHYEGHGPSRDRPGVNSTGWHLAGSRDRRLISLLFPTRASPATRRSPPGCSPRSTRCAPAHPGSSEDGSPAEETSDLPSHLLRVRELLGDLLAQREDLLASVRLDLHEALEDIVKDAHERSEAVELLIVRMWLAELDDTLALLRNKTGQLGSVGLRSARKLAQRLETGVAAGILPYGMLGKAIVGYRVTGLDDPGKNAVLAAESISGDPQQGSTRSAGQHRLSRPGRRRTPGHGSVGHRLLPPGRTRARPRALKWVDDRRRPRQYPRQTPYDHRLGHQPGHPDLRHPPAPQTRGADQARRPPLRHCDPQGARADRPAPIRTAPTQPSSSTPTSTAATSPWVSTPQASTPAACAWPCLRTGAGRSCLRCRPASRN